MKNSHLDQLTKLLKRTRPRLASTHELAFKNVFGAVGGYVNGNMFISCGTFGVALRLPSGPLERTFREKGVKHLQYFPKGHIKKEYAVLPTRILEDTKQFGALVDISISYAYGE